MRSEKHPKSLALVLGLAVLVGWSPAREMARLVHTSTMDWLAAGALPVVANSVLMSKNNGGGHASAFWYPTTGACIDSLANGHTVPLGPDAGPLAGESLKSLLDGGAWWSP